MKNLSRKSMFFITLFGGWFGLHKYMKHKILIGVLYTLTLGIFFLGWLYDVCRAFYLLVNDNQSNISKEQIQPQVNQPIIPVQSLQVVPPAIPVQPTQPSQVTQIVELVHNDKTSNTSKTERHKVAGVSHYLDNILSMAIDNPYYELSKEEIVDEFLVDEHIYQYYFSTSKTELIEEPDNEYDSNAIKVIIDGMHIGYIKKGSCTHIKNLFKADRIKSITSEIYGGTYKYVYEDEEEDDKYYMDIIGDKNNFKITITLTLKNA